jgi:hypothetical protein
LGIGNIKDNSQGARVNSDSLLAKEPIADVIWKHNLDDHEEEGTSGGNLKFIKDIEGGRWKIVNDQMIFLKKDNNTEVARFNLFDKNQIRTQTKVYQRVRVSEAEIENDPENNPPVAPPP